MLIKKNSLLLIIVLVTSSQLYPMQALRRLATSARRAAIGAGLTATQLMLLNQQASCHTGSPATTWYMIESAQHDQYLRQLDNICNAWAHAQSDEEQALHLKTIKQMLQHKTKWNDASIYRLLRSYGLTPDAIMAPTETGTLH
jgi:hypothetical protein